MALNTKVGSFAINTTTGNQAVTGVGFKPLIVLFFGNRRTADGDNTSQTDVYLGAAVSSADRRTATGYGPINSTSAYAGHDNTRCLSLINSGPGTDIDADLVSMDADGFTINVTTNGPASAAIVNYIALGGADLTNAKTGQITCPAATGSQATTGVGFKPDCILFFEVRTTGVAPPSVANSGPRPTLGFGTSSSARGVSHAAQNETGSVNTAKSYQRTSSVYAMVTSTVSLEADLTSLDSDGFTLNWTTVTSGRYVFWVALKGGQYKVGAFNQATSTGNQATTGVGFQPTGLLLVSDNNAASTSVQANQTWSLGAGSSSSARGCIWLGEDDGGSQSANTNQNLDRTKIIKMISEGTPTVNAAADLVSLDSDGFTVNWTTADATARQVLYLALGSNAGGTIPNKLTQVNQAVNRAGTY